jgi:uncharacterized protein YneR
MASDNTNDNAQLGSNKIPTQRKREIPSGGLTVEEGMNMGIRARSDIFQKATDNPDLWYFDPKTSRYKKRPEPLPDFSIEQQANPIKPIPSQRQREIPSGGLTVEEGMNMGIRARSDIFQKATDNPDLWYFDPKTSRYKKRPEPLPDFSLGGEQRAIPCFLEGTLVVTTTHGLVPIELLTLGMKVPAFDEFRQAMVDKPITELLRHKTTRLVNVTTDRETIYATTRHRFWVENKKKWVAAKELKPGMLLQTVTGGVSKIKMVVVQDIFEQNTYNLTVAECHTFFVGKYGVLVHNQDTRNGKVYIGRDPQGNIIYVGQTKQDILNRQKNHHANAIKKPEIYGYKKDMKLEVIIDGLTDDEMHYHERRVFEQLTAQGIKLRYEQEPMGYAGINELIQKYC